MKKKTFPQLFVLLSGLFFPGVVPAQTLLPEAWELFITEQNTVLVSDTFRLQTFSESPVDNWAYEAREDAAVVNAEETAFTGTSGGALLRLAAGGSVEFARFDSLLHQQVKGGMSYAAQNLMKGENLKIVFFQGDSTKTGSICKAGENNYSSAGKHVSIKTPFEGLRFEVESVSNTEHGGYALDSVYAFGEIPLFSLFRGKGDWRDTARWSDLPAERHRNALVKGRATVSTDLLCDTIHVAGTLEVEPEVRLRTREVNLFETSSFLNRGSLQVDGRVCLTRNFSRKGVWYFVSFPFDVYAEGVDPDFSLGDDQTNTGGNYFYVLTYDGEKRSTERSGESCWTVVPASAAQGDLPLFEKGKGYLLAIDEEADRTTLCFSSAEGAVPDSFGKTEAFTLTVPYAVEETDPERGWILCGNPLPSPLPLGAFDHPDLDGFVYVFNGEGYSAIGVTGNYALPPFSAFFLKAKRSVTLSVGLMETAQEELLQTLPLRGVPTAPSVERASGNEQVKTTIGGRLEGDVFRLSGTTGHGRLQVYDSAGRSITSSSFAEGAVVQIALPREKGFYIVVATTEQGIYPFKVVR